MTIICRDDFGNEILPGSFVAHICGAGCSNRKLSIHYATTRETMVHIITIYNTTYSTFELGELHDTCSTALLKTTPELIALKDKCLSGVRMQ